MSKIFRATKYRLLSKFSKSYESYMPEFIQIDVNGRCIDGSVSKSTDTGNSGTEIA